MAEGASGGKSPSDHAEAQIRRSGLGGQVRLSRFRRAVPSRHVRVRVAPCYAGGPVIRAVRYTGSILLKADRLGFRTRPIALCAIVRGRGARVANTRWLGRVATGSRGGLYGILAARRRGLIRAPYSSLVANARVSLSFLAKLSSRLIVAKVRRNALPGASTSGHLGAVPFGGSAARL